MALQLGALGGGLAGWASARGPLKLLFNPMIAALVITVLAMAIIFAILDTSKQTKANPARARMRCGIYVFLAVLAVEALHYYALDRRLSEKYGDRNRSGIMHGIHAAQSTNIASPHQIAFAPRFGGGPAPAAGPAAVPPPPGPPNPGAGAGPAPLPAYADGARACSDLVLDPVIMPSQALGRF